MKGLLGALVAAVLVVGFFIPREASAGGNQVLVVQAQKARQSRGFIAPRLRAGRAAAQVQALNAVAVKNSALARSNAVVVRSHANQVSNLRALNAHALQLQALSYPQILVQPQSVVVPQSVIIQQHVAPQAQILIQPHQAVPQCRSKSCR